MLSKNACAVLFGACLLIFCLPGFSEAVGDYSELCRLFKNGTNIRKPGTCDEYIHCSDGEGIMKFCEGTTPYYNSIKQECVQELSNSHLYCGNRCEGRDGTWVSDPTNCEQYFYCRDGVPLAGACPIGQHFNESSQACMHGVDSQCVDVANICEILPENTAFRYEDDCSYYYVCKNSKQTLTKCKSTLYFNVETGDCVARNLVACDAHSKEGVCAASSKVVFKSDSATCRGYFICKAFGTVADLDPLWNQCPEGTFFDEERQLCGKATDVVCTHNRCDGRGTMLVVSSKNYCHNYIQCVDGLEVAESTCHFDHFFDEVIQACSSKIIYDNCCDEQPNSS
ncbi:peritrophin-44 [Drosophila miranda]|uniref:peritrophin-44 n=1 Tax=Drosophila miranda TaxID=7229 RepID=UPI0007E701CD|nr:peritrophin-44 [Drosophila miranda]